MNTTNPISSSKHTTKSDDGPDLIQLVHIVRRNWLIFAICFGIAIAAAYLYIRYTRPVYVSKASVLIKTSQGAESNIQDAIVKEIGLGSSNKLLENEVQIFKSRTLMEHTVRSLGMEVSLESEGRVKNSQFFNLQSPVQIDTYSIGKSLLPAHYNLTIKDQNTFIFSNGSITTEGKFGQPFSIDSFTMIARYVTSVPDFPYTILLHFNTVDVMAERLSNNLKVISDIEKGNVLELSLEDEVPSRANALLDSLISFYNKLGIEESNQVALNTIQFIDDRLKYITGELTDVEQGLQKFKEQNKTLGISSEGELLLESISSYDKEVSTLEIQKDILNSIRKYLNDGEKKFEYVPTNMGLTDLTLVGLLEQFNTLLSQRLRLKSTAAESNPRWLEINAQIDNTREKILQSIQTMQQDLNIALQRTQNKARELQARVRTAPRMERQFLEIRRQQNIKENLYLFLLQKREEAALSLAMTVPNAQIIDPAKNSAKPIKPVKRTIAMIALTLGLIGAAGLIFIRESLNQTIKGEEELKRLVAIPFLGSIGLSRNKSSIVMTQDARSAVAESFRALRTNLSFLSQGKQESQVILITSSISGEGKSFISVNLALSYAILGKKVAIVGLDLRKPKLNEYLGSNTLQGVSTWLSGQGSLDQIIQPTQAHQNVSLIGSGPIPPNPAELLQSDRIPELFAELRKRFDYIILDTSPVGLVTDAYLISHYADMSIYVVRSHYTRIEQTALPNELYTVGKLRNMGLILNGVNQSGRYGYSYGYGNGYYVENQPRGIIQRIKRLFGR